LEDPGRRRRSWPARLLRWALRPDHRHLHEDAPRLEVDAVLALALRTLPYLTPVLRELRPLVPILVPILLLGIPTTMVLTDLVMNRMLAGNALTPLEAWLLFFEPAEYVRVERLTAVQQAAVRDRLLLAGLVAFVVFTPVVLWIANLLIRVRQRINQILRVQIVERLQSMSLRFHASSRVGDAVYRTYQDSAMVTNLMGLLVSPLGPLLGVTVGLFMAFVFDWRLSASLALLYVALFALVRRFTPHLRHDFRVARERNSALTSRIQETLAGLKVVKAYGVEAAEQRRFEDASLSAFEAAFAARTRFALLGVLAFGLAALPPMIAAAWLAVLAAEGRPLAFGFALGVVGFATWNLGAHADASRRIAGAASSARRLLHLWARAQDMAVGMERAFERVDLRPEVADAEDAVPFPGLREAVTFRGVTFGYDPGHPVVRDVDLRAEVGTVTALVGPTGSGKSTLVALLLRLFDPDEGAIEVDGTDLRRFRLESLRAGIGIALQENLLFGTTIRENIRYAVPGGSDAEVREAARIACADGFIERTPHGYDTELGERGTKLSTGQRQRISIARAVLKDTPILVLDEPTASLDAETELRVLRNLAAWGRERAIFLVTHRLSTIRRADRIVYLRDGLVVESGSHDELMERPEGAYRRFVEIERAGVEAVASTAAGASRGEGT